MLLLSLVGTAVAVCATDRPVAPQARSFLRPATRSGDEALAADAVWRLGRHLFFDPSLSASGKTSCASCHDVGRGWSGTTALAIGDAGRSLAFRTPTLIDVGTLDRLGWTGRFADTAAVSLFAATSPNNMNMSTENLAARLHSTPTIDAAFRDAFGDEAVSAPLVGRALARFVNSITTAPAPFDRWAAGDPDAIGENAKRGFALFVGKAHCAECHSGPSFTDGSFHDIGVSDQNLGRGALFKTSVKLQHAFKTPSLRNVADRPRFLHDGSKASLADVVDQYDQGGIERASRAEEIKPLHLTTQEKADLVSFLQSLSGPVVFTSPSTR